MLAAGGVLFKEEKKGPVASALSGGRDAQRREGTTSHPSLGKKNTKKKKNGEDGLRRPPFLVRRKENLEKKKKGGKDASSPIPLSVRVALGREGKKTLGNGEREREKEEKSSGGRYFCIPSSNTEQGGK